MRLVRIRRAAADASIAPMSKRFCKEAVQWPLKAFSRRALSRPRRQRDQLGAQWVDVADVVRACCCAVEMMHAGASRYDLDRFGVVFRPSSAAIRT
jgi:hypothetical protein